MRQEWLGVRFAWPWYVTFSAEIAQSAVVSHMVTLAGTMGTSVASIAWGIVGLIPVFICQFPSNTVAAVFFVFKTKQSGIMLDHFAKFDVRCAQCTESSDRPALYDQIATATQKCLRRAQVAKLHQSRSK